MRVIRSDLADRKTRWFSGMKCACITEFYCNSKNTQQKQKPHWRKMSWIVFFIQEYIFRTYIYLQVELNQICIVITCKLKLANTQKTFINDKNIHQRQKRHRWKILRTVFYTRIRIKKIPKYNIVFFFSFY